MVPVCTQAPPTENERSTNATVRLGDRTGEDSEWVGRARESKRALEQALADRLRKRRPRLRVLFVSGYPSDSPGAGSVLPQGTGFLQKPFTAAALVRAVTEALAGRD